MEGSGAAAVAQAQAGEQDDFRLLVERHSHSVFRLAYRMTGNEHDAEEVVQETFLRAYRGYDRFEARSQFGTWLHRIATNCALDLLRARQQRNAHRSLEDPERNELVPLPSSEPGPDRLVLSAEVQRRVKAAMSRLSAPERAAFVLRHFEGLSVEEIAHALRLSQGAARNAIFRAVHKLRRALEGCW